MNKVKNHIFYGYCFCGAISYELKFSDSSQVKICHDYCTDCCRATGGAIVPWFSVTRPVFSWKINGNTMTSDWKNPGANDSPLRAHVNPKSGAYRYFCSDCGSSLAFWKPEGGSQDDWIDVTITTLGEESLKVLEPLMKDSHFSSHFYWEEGLQCYKPWMKAGGANELSHHQPHHDLE